MTTEEEQTAETTPYVPPPEKQPSKTQQNISWYLSLVVIALLIILPPIWCGFLYLSRVPDVTWEGSDGVSFDRIWMHRERRPVGIAHQSRRVIKEYSPTEVCAETQLRFYLWGKSREADPSTASQVLTFANNRWQPAGEDCP